jgi:hypothetical protein
MISIVLVNTNGGYKTPVRVWYQSVESDSFFLDQVILPALRKLLYQEVLDIGEVGVVVARILLLLVMDATDVVEKNSGAMRCYVGAFYSVYSFLGMLSGESQCEDDNLQRYLEQ